MYLALLYRDEPPARESRAKAPKETRVSKALPSGEKHSVASHNFVKAIHFGAAETPLPGNEHSVA